ncbi:MAG TPA: tetratricopeptide repeat protein [Gaiellaceae bacterium]|nr:tetratricopeptide repeat protein [Gaiellaceae bacterium]
MALRTVPKGTLLAPYVPRLLHAWSADPGERWRAVEGSLVSVDISGFTALAERLASFGRRGAEELVLTVSGVFAELIAVADRHGGDVLKFRGDALLLLFTGDRYVERACGAASDMQWTIGAVGSSMSSVGPVSLTMSAGVHAGLCQFFLTELPHRELLVAGPAATRVFELEDLATAGEIVVSAETAASLDPDWLGETREDARLLQRLELGASTIEPPPFLPGDDLARFVPASLRDHLAVASGEAEHRQVTVAFVKVGETDRLLEREGPDALLQQLDSLAASVDHACSAYEITWLESDIDVNAVKLYLTAGAPFTSGEDEEGMLRAVREILAADVVLPVRAGVTRGHVFTGDIGAGTRRTYAVMGDAVNLAARLTARAQPGEIMATVDVLEHARTEYRTEVEPLLVKGKEMAILAQRVLEPIGMRPGAVPDAGPIVGREPELAALAAAVEDARLRQLRLVEIVGEPGIGKSRLVQELRGLAGGLQLLETAGEHYATAEPYAAVRPLLRRLVGIPDTMVRQEAGRILAAFVNGAMPDLVPWVPLLAGPFDAEVPGTAEADALDAGRSRDRLHQVVGSLLERLLLMPTLVVVEDAHWLDDASRELLHALTAAPAARPWLVCLTMRPGTDPPPQGDHVLRLELEPLRTEAAAALALDVAEAAALSEDTISSLVERSGGNPLFVRELVWATRHGEELEGLPDTIERLLTARIDTLDPVDRMLLRYAAVVGPSFDLSLIESVLADDDSLAGTLERWAPLREFLIDGGENRLAFRHDLVRATAYEGLSFGRRADIHGRVGAAIEERLGNRAEEEAALLSFHFHEAKDFARSWRYSVAAGKRAHSGFANVVAAELYERALEAANGVPGLEQQTVAGIAEALGDVCERFGDYARADAAYGRSLELASADPVVETRLAWKRAALHEHSGRYADAISAYESGLARLEELPSEPDLARNRIELELGIAGVHYRQGAFEQTITWGERAAAHASEAGDRGRLAHAYYVLANYDLGHPDGFRYCELALPIFEELMDSRGQGSTLNNLGIRLYYEGRWEESLAAYRSAREAMERAGDVIGEATLANNEGEILSDQGHLEEAEEAFRHMLRASRAAGYAIGAALATSNLARVAARGRRFEEARELFAEAIASFEAIEAHYYVAEARARLAECDVLEGRHAEAIELATAVLADENAAGPVRILAERVLGYALHQARRPDDARPHFEESLRLAREGNSDYEAALTLRAIADTASGAAGDTDRAGGAEAAATMARLGVASLPRVPLP